MHKLSRREALRGTSVAALAAGAAVVPLGRASARGKSGHGEDAELIRLGRELERLWSIERPLWEACSASEDPEVAQAYYEQGAEAQDTTFRIVDKIVALSATTMAGLKVKALAFRCTTSGEQPGDVMEELAHGIAADLRTISEEARS